MIKLEEITADNLEDVLKLKVSKNQENFVSTTAYSLAQAYVYQENAYPLQYMPMTHLWALLCSDFTNRETNIHYGSSS